ncbi:hypothetical protein [Paenibacillus borealis]|uniref:Uncharacterized protein n=1 Tax=Paenibacillus borealis TaxID=160799 RepID=A0A089LAV6_PAEBO|nr:hypothetical protein [Paenibacillus borealis]AIQ57240.1 hypothetical protein PBOR_10080 [Paenibacillus borealis]
MKYNNLPAKPPKEGEMLPFVQQFRIMAVLMSRMLYLVQEFESDSGHGIWDLRRRQWTYRRE